MRRGWRLVGFVRAVLAVSASGRLRAEAPPAGASGVAVITEAEREKLKDDVSREKFDEAEKTVNEWRRRSLEKTTDETLFDASAPKDKLEQRFNQAVDNGQWGLAEYYLEQIRTQAENPAIFKPALDLTIWTIVVFLLLLAVLYAFAWKPMMQGLQKRESDIHSAVEDARTAREEAQRLRQEVQAERAKIEQSRRETILKAEADAQRRADEIVAAAEAKMKAERDRALRELETAKDQALQELWRQTANLASVVSTKAIRRSLTPDDHRRFVDEALAELRTEAGNGQKTTASA